MGFVMKMKKFVFLSAVMLTVMFMAVAVHAGTASLSGVEGDVSVQLKTDAAWAAGTNGMTIPEGASIKTGADGKASLTWGAGNVVKLYPLSIVKATEVSGAERKSSVLSLEKGRAMSKVDKLGADASFELRTPTAVAGVRGTGFDTEITPGTAMVTIAVVEGTVVMSVGDIEVVLDEGFESSALPGEVPGAPMMIPPGKLGDLKTELSVLKSMVKAELQSQKEQKKEEKQEAKDEAKAETKADETDSTADIVDTVTDNTVENVTINDDIAGAAEEAVICNGGVGCLEGTISIQSY